MIEVRSYRRVFDLERRVYSVDRLRLNPGGVPVRGLVYFLGLLLAALIIGGLPFAGPLAKAAPWYLRDLLAPGLLAAVLCLVQVDGRTFHLAAFAMLRFCLQPCRVDGLCHRSSAGVRWALGPVTILPDGSDGYLRRLRYGGPGAVLVMVEHELKGAPAGGLRAWLARSSVQISPDGEGSPLERGIVVSLEREAVLSVVSDAKAPRT